MSPIDVDADEKPYTQEDMRQLFNKKYSEARGEVGLRVPYLAGGFHVEGLPENVVFKKPRHYRSAEITKIMNQRDNVRFIIDKQPEEKASQPSLAAVSSSTRERHVTSLPTETPSLQEQVASSQPEPPATTTVPTATVLLSSTTCPMPPSSVSTAQNLAVANGVQSLVGYKRGQDVAALGFRYPDRKTLHGADIPDGYECVLVKWVKSNDINSVLVLGDPEENTHLSAGQFFALPTSSLVHVVLNHPLA